jgi:arylsulfatase A-like enzyme
MPPNILLIILDTVRRDHLSAYGYRAPASQRATSPILDDFAADATLFENGVSAAQWTIPSHASLFTGHYPSGHHLTQAYGRLPADLPTLAELLRGAGYHTAAFCNNPLLGVLDHGLQRGFDQFFNYAGAAPYRPRDLQRHPLHKAAASRFRRFAYGVQNRFAQNADLFRLSLHPLLVNIWTRALNFKGNTAQSLADAAQYWQTHAQRANAAARPTTAPLFTFINLMGAHLPYRPPRRLLEQYAPDVSRSRASLDFIAQFNADAGGWAAPRHDTPFADWQLRALDGFYDAEINRQDTLLADLLATLRNSGTLDNTLVLVSADHGEGHGDHHFFGHGFVVHHELVHVPLIVRHPDGWPRSARISGHVSTRRLFHTALEAAGVGVPNAAPLSLSHSLAPANDPEGGTTMSEAFPPTTFLNVLQRRTPALIGTLGLNYARRAITTPQHKLLTIDDQIEALYDLRTDAQEQHNIAPTHNAIARDLQRRLNTLVVQASANHAPDDQADGAVSATVEEHLRALGYME